MNTYQSFATALTALLGTDMAVRIRVEGYMPLSIESIGTSADGNRIIALCHSGEQHGALRRDPEMVFGLFAHGEVSAAEPLSFRNDYIGFSQEVYRYDNKKTHVHLRLKQGLTSFAGTWFKNLKETGVLGEITIREPLT